MPVDICKLCLQTRELQRSHLMPRSLYKKTRWEGTPNPNPLLVSGKGSIQTSTQVADFVLCRECEQRFSERGERYAMNLVDHNGNFPLLNQLNAVPPTRDRGFGRFYDATATPDIDRKELAYFALRVILQFFQAEDTCRLLSAAAEMKAGLASAVLLRFGIDTLATGFWLAFVAPDAYFVGHGQEHIPSDLSRIVQTLPPSARDMLDDVLKRPVNNDPTKTLLSYVLNPATHGDALVNVQRVGSAPAAGFNWAVHLRDVMQALTNNFIVLLRDEAGIDVFKEMQSYEGNPKLAEPRPS